MRLALQDQLSSFRVEPVAALRTVRQREPLWRLHDSVQFGVMGMTVLLVVSSATHSATLDLVDVFSALGFIVYSLCTWNVQQRFSARRR